MKATVQNSSNLQKRAEAINTGRTDGTYFYVNGNSVTVSNPFFNITEEGQRLELEWFLNDREFELSNN